MSVHDGLRERLRLYVILDPQWCVLPVLEVARAALAGGARCLQLRAKDAQSDRERLELVRALRGPTREAGALLVVNDRVDLALAGDADGVHVGPEDLPVAVVRRLLGAERLVGASAPSPEAARAAESEGADHLGVGALYEARPIKPNASAPRGAAWVREVCAGTQLPVVGIGGIDLATAAEVVAAGASGVAVVRAVCAAADPEAATRALLRQVEQGLRA